MNPITKMASLAAHNTIAASLIVGGSAIGLTAVGFIVRPADVLSMTSTSDDQSLQISSLSEDRAEVVGGLKRLISSAHAVIDVRTSGDATELLLWTNDKCDPGVVNEDELLIISYAPLLRAAIAMTVSPGPGAEGPLDSAALFSDRLAFEWRRRPDVNQTVITTNVTAMRIESVRRGDGTAALSVALTFAPDNSEMDERPHAEAMFVVTLPAVSRSR